MTNGPRKPGLHYQVELRMDESCRRDFFIALNRKRATRCGPDRTCLFRPGGSSLIVVRPMADHYRVTLTGG